MSSLPTVNQPIELIRFRNFSGENGNDSKKRIALVLAAGYNTFNLKMEDSNILKDKLNNVFGNSFTAGTKIRHNEKWRTTVLLNFNRLHSTFEHTRYLDTIYDIEQSLKIKRKEVTFHNNFTNLLGLQLGVERKVYSINQFQLNAGLAVAPTYTLSTNGKTTQNTLVEKLVYDNEISKFSAAGVAKLNAIYAINNSINIEASYQFNQFFVNEIFINTNVFTNRQSIFTFGFAYRNP